MIARPLVVRRVAAAGALAAVLTTFAAAQSRSGNAAARAAYDRRVEETLEIIRSAPCELSTQKMERFGEDLDTLAADAGITNGQTGLFLNTQRLSLCENKRTGGLPPLEKALWAMFDARRFDPCTYDPNHNYDAILGDPRYETFQNRSTYNDGTIVYFYGQILGWTPEKRRCFLDVIKRAIVSAP